MLEQADQKMKFFSSFLLYAGGTIQSVSLKYLSTCFLFFSSLPSKSAKLGKVIKNGAFANLMMKSGKNWAGKKDPLNESGLVLHLLAPDISGLWELNVMMCVRAPLKPSRQACIKRHIIPLMNIALQIIRKSCCLK